MTLHKSGFPEVLLAAVLTPAQSVLKQSLRRQRTQRIYPETGNTKLTTKQQTEKQSNGH